MVGLRFLLKRCYGDFEAVIYHHPAHHIIRESGFPVTWNACHDRKIAEPDVEMIFKAGNSDVQGSLVHVRRQFLHPVTRFSGLTLQNSRASPARMCFQAGRTRQTPSGGDMTGDAVVTRK